MKPTLFNYRPKYKLISEEIQKTKLAFDSVVANFMGKLSLLSTSLMSRALSFNPNNKNHDEIIRKTTDCQQSVTAKVSRLLQLQQRLNRRLRTIAKKVGFGSGILKARMFIQRKSNQIKLFWELPNMGT